MISRGAAVNTNLQIIPCRPDCFERKFIETWHRQKTLAQLVGLHYLPVTALQRHTKENMCTSSLGHTGKQSTIHEINRGDGLHHVERF
jgi:hypothetical protein